MAALLGRIPFFEPASVCRAEGAEVYQPRASKSASAALGLRIKTGRALKGRE
jgi:hypothetical protein